MTRSFWLLGLRANILAGHTDTEGRYDLIEAFSPPGFQTPPHRHTRYPEQVYLLEGELTVWLGEQKFVVHPGD
jgi:quercetin dioxygenase-like cupin family protein